MKLIGETLFALLFTDTRTHGQTDAQSDCNKPLAGFNNNHNDRKKNNNNTKIPFVLSHPGIHLSSLCVATVKHNIVCKGELIVVYRQSKKTETKKKKLEKGTKFFPSKALKIKINLFNSPF